MTPRLQRLIDELRYEIQRAVDYGEIDMRRLRFGFVLLDRDRSSIRCEFITSRFDEMSRYELDRELARPSASKINVNIIVNAAK